MARNACFLPGTDRAFEERIIEYRQQKRKDVLAFRKAVSEYYPDKKILEISRKSDNSLGVRLSAVNLKLDGYPLECVYQSSKHFEGDGRFDFLLYEKPEYARKYVRDNAFGDVICFVYNGMLFNRHPKTMFYDYIYIKAVCQSGIDLSKLLEYGAFTDIDFNPAVSYNCQARSCAILVHLLKNGTLNHHLSSVDSFRELYRGNPYLI